MIKSLAFAAALCAATLPASAQTAASPPAQPAAGIGAMAPEITALFEVYMNAQHVPGLVFGMIQKQRGGDAAGEPGLKRDDLSVEICALYNQTGQPKRALALVSTRSFQPVSASKSAKFWIRFSSCNLGKKLARSITGVF